MRKTILYLVLLALIGGAAYYFVFYKPDTGFPKSEASFGVKDTAAIGKLFLSTPFGDNILLERSDSGWVLNKKYKALRSTLEMLMEVLYKQEAKYPAPEASHNGIITGLAGNGVKVEVYDRKGNKMKTFYVGSEAHESSGSYMLLEGAPRAYLVHIPGIGGILKPSYTTSIGDWRDRTVFNVPASDIATVAVTYPEEPLNSFTIHQNEQLTVDADNGVKGTHPLNEKRVKDYLGFFQNINNEGYLNGKLGVDSSISVSPKKCTVELVTKNGRVQKLDVYWKPLSKRSKNATESSHDIKPGYDGDRYYAVYNNHADTALIQEYNFGKLFRKAYEFYQ